LEEEIDQLQQQAEELAAELRYQKHDRERNYA